jgi:diguanylate cyclase (GGDEF)-like protein
VLALYDRLGADDFDDGDLVTLRTFAGQAAVAVENVLLHQEAQRLSLTDPLTGLWNHRYLRVSLRREVERAARFARSLAVLLVDLDRFRDVNDDRGPQAGDAILAVVASQIATVVREVDMVFRRTGEEFVVLLPETSAEGACRAADRLCTALREHPVPLGSPGRELLVHCTVSVGIAVYPDHAEDAQLLLDRAESALHAAKAAGRDTWRIAPAQPRADGRDPAPEPREAAPGDRRQLSTGGLPDAAAARPGDVTQDTPVDTATERG